MVWKRWNQTNQEVNIEVRSALTPKQTKHQTWPVSTRSWEEEAQGEGWRLLWQAGDLRGQGVMQGVGDSSVHICIINSNATVRMLPLSRYCS